VYRLSVKILLSVLILLLPLTFFGQEEQHGNIQKTERSSYIQKEDTLINFKFSFYNLDQEFSVTGNGIPITIQPNFTLKTRFFINYKFVSLAFALAPGFLPGNHDNDLKGKTKSFTFNLNFFMNHWVQESQFNRTKGFYINNPGDYKLPGWTPYIQLPEMKLLVLRGATSYLINSNFSLKAVRNHTEIQKKSAGSFMPSLIYSFYSINNDDEERGQSHQNSHNFEGLVALWYMHTFVVHKNWYISGGVAPAVGYGFTKLDTYFENEHDTNNYSEPVFRLNEQASIGANFKRFFTGVQILASQTKESQGDSPVTQKNYYTTFQVFAGYRFNAPKFMRKNSR
jgi:hypothetical protein